MIWTGWTHESYEAQVDSKNSHNEVVLHLQPLSQQKQRLVEEEEEEERDARSWRSKQDVQDRKHEEMDRGGSRRREEEHREQREERRRKEEMERVDDFLFFTGRPLIRQHDVLICKEIATNVSVENTIGLTSWLIKLVLIDFLFNILTNDRYPFPPSSQFRFVMKHKRSVFPATRYFIRSEQGWTSTKSCVALQSNAMIFHWGLMVLNRVTFPNGALIHRILK